MSGGRCMLIVQHPRESESPAEPFSVLEDAAGALSSPCVFIFLIPRPAPLTLCPSFRHG